MISGQDFIAKAPTRREGGTSNVPIPTLLTHVLSQNYPCFLNSPPGLEGWQTLRLTEVVELLLQKPDHKGGRNVQRAYPDLAHARPVANYPWFQKLPSWS